MDQYQTDTAGVAGGAPVATATEGGSRRLALYYVHPLAAGALGEWPRLLDHVAGLGFSDILLAPPFAAASVLLADRFDALHPALAWSGDAASGLRHIAEACAARGLGLWLDLVLDRVDADGAVARAHPDLFAVPGGAVADPRFGAPAARARPEAGPLLAAWWAEMLGGWLQAGVSGARLVGLEAVAPRDVAALIAAVRGAGRPARFLAGTEGVATERLAALRLCGLDYASVLLGDGPAMDERFWDRLDSVAAVAAPLAWVEAPFAPRRAARIADAVAVDGELGWAARVAAMAAGAWLMPMGFEAGETEPLDPRHQRPHPPSPRPALAELVRAVNAEAPVAARPVTASGVEVPALAEGSAEGGARAAAVTLFNDSPVRSRTISLLTLAAALGCEAPPPVVLRPGEAKRVPLAPLRPIRRGRQARATTAEAAAKAGRVSLERIEPAVGDGRFAAKRRVGDSLVVEADVLCDGHDKLAAVLQYRPADEMNWRETRMALAENDRWRGACDLTRPGRWVFRVQAWRDAFASFRDELAKKSAAGIDVRLELMEGRAQVAEAAHRLASLETLAKGLADMDPATQVTTLLSAPLAELMAQADERPLATTSAPYPVDADRIGASYASWYEIFPRSMSDDESRHGTFQDVTRHLPRIAAMGFDVLYFPPIHPIGRSNRKGRNNALRAAEGDPGSPYAIGAETGGHDAIHPELGTLEDFRAMLAAAEAHGLEIALDFAIQCAPDHPWLREHPGWFAWRPDGSMRYAENPPKKYEDIVNVDFFAKDSVPALWVALCEVVLFWAEQGVRTFRVDNPHTKPFGFWEWLINEVRAPYPDAVFLAEAFTRPKIMNRLAKLGFTQSYTYFTWRNTKRELTEYLTELATSEQRDFFRPNFFVNTPDINPPFLQTGGRPAHLIRATLAATLSGLWGVYSGFELCEATPVPGREEYLDSEKYQLRAWDWQRPGNIVHEITRLNRIRRRNPALQTHLGVTFLPADDDQVLFYEKATPDRSNVVLVAVSLDPHNARSAAIELPLWRWSLPDHASLACDDLLGDATFTLAGKWQRVTLTPDAPAAIWRARPVN